MSIALLERAASALDDLLKEVVFLGGATIGLWITDPAAPEPRPTKDVDVIVEVTSRGRFAEFEERLRAHGPGERHHLPLVATATTSSWMRCRPTPRSLALRTAGKPRRSHSRCPASSRQGA